MPYKDIEKSREASRKAARKYYAKRSAESEEFRQANRDKSNAWHARNRERARAATTAWRREFKLRDPASWKEYNREAGRKYRFHIKAEMVAAYGGKCVCCDEVRVEFLTINHIHGGGAKHRRSLQGNERVGGIHFYFWLKKQGWPKDDYNLMCFNCNCSKGFLGYCPHEREREAAMASSNSKVHSEVQPDN